VRLVPYAPFYDHGWHVDLEALLRRFTPRSKAVVIVHPNNPTGHFTRHADRVAIQAFCREHNLALIVDEVFLDYSLPGHDGQESFAIGSHPIPTFVLSGLSKVVALPQMKAAWIACFGEEGEQAEALQRLEVISDTFLSMSTPIQCALPGWLRQRAEPQRQIRQRLQANLKALDTILGRQTLVTRLEIEAGWFAVLRIPGLLPDDETALELLLERGVVVHPGDFYGFSGQGWLVISLLTPEQEFSAGVAAISQHFRDH
jgi:alanine-synthesizing transaminase